MTSNNTSDAFRLMLSELEKKKESGALSINKYLNKRLDIERLVYAFAAQQNTVHSDFIIDEFVRNCGLEFNDELLALAQQHNQIFDRPSREDTEP